MERIRESVANNGYSNLCFSSYLYTWDNKRDHGDNIQVRLDRATCNGEFAHLFPATEVQHVMTEESDHQALVIKALTSVGQPNARGQRPFSYEAAWARHEEYESMVAVAW